MNKSSVLLLASILTFSSYANAEWTLVSEGSRTGKFYVDYDRITKKNGYTYFWKLSSYSQPQTQGYMSMLTYVLLDCKHPRRSMNLQMRAFDRPLRRGNNIATWSPPKEWDYPAPDSVMEILLNEVCKR
jgi:hypothetical protein